MYTNKFTKSLRRCINVCMYAHVLEVSFRQRMFDGGLSFSVLHVAYVAVCYCHAT